ASGEVGAIYSCRMFYGNGTAGLERETAWLEVGPVARSFHAYVMVTVSPGSVALFVGKQPFMTSAEVSRTTTGFLMTKTVKMLVECRGGTPSSVTTVRKRFVLLFCSGAGVQVIIPLDEMSAPFGADKNW